LPPTILRDVALATFNTFGIEARAARWVTINSVAELASLWGGEVWRCGPRLILGGGSNLLLRGDFEGLIIHMRILGRACLAEDATAWRVRLGAGENWHQAVLWTLLNGRPGLENLALIPGTVGAAPIQNIGAYGVELAERFESLEAFDTVTGKLEVFDRAACAFGYRDSIFKHQPGRYVIVSLTLCLPRPWRPVLNYGDLQGLKFTLDADQPDAPRRVAETVIAIRRAKLPDPAQIGNAGSFFKNPSIDSRRHAELLKRFPGLVSYAQAGGGFKLAAGWLIDRCGWKGRSLGRAAVHERQALVLVNRGAASGAEILALAEEIRADVSRTFGVDLEIEPTVV